MNHARGDTMDMDAKEFKDEQLIRTFDYVFDQSTLSAIRRLAAKKEFEQLEYVISTGKEAHVFRAVDHAGNYRAVKIYKTSASTFHHMAPYMEGDKRFSNGKQDKRDLVFEWVKKEFKNLGLLQRAGIPAPMPNAYLDNVLVMSLIMDADGNPAPSLQDVNPKTLDGEVIYQELVEMLSNLWYKAKLIHADFSAFNLLFDGEHVVTIDVGQAVTLSHPKAKIFLDRDLENTAKYAKRLGINKTPEEVKEDVKAFHEKNR